MSCSGAAFADSQGASEGAALFNGSAPLIGRVAGDTDVLPAVASRCVNCHGRATKAIAGGTYASPLDAAWLMTPRVRHGGPATLYDEAAFCTLLRTGVDPAQVLIPPVMPRYDATNAQCASLWTFLRSR